MDIKLQIAFFVLGGIAVAIGALWMLSTERRLKRFFLGTKAKDLEGTLIALQNEVRALAGGLKRAEQEIAAMNAKLRKSIRGLETIRFNPFPDQGGNQSFAIGMLDEDGDGLVLSSLYSRDRMSVFAKPVKGGMSTYELTAEEKEALQKAKV